MKKFYIVILLLSVMTAVSAQKMTIKTASGQTVEISCEGMVPGEIQVEGDKVTFKMNNSADAVSAEAPEAEVAENEAEKADSIDTFVPVGDTDTELVDTSETPEEGSELASSEPSIGSIANAIAEELSPEYAAFNKEHEGYHPESEGELMKNVAKKVIDPDVVESVDFFASLFKGMRFTKDSTFVPQYEQRKPKPKTRAYDIIELSGNLGKNIDSAEGIADKISANDYGDDTENENKYGGGIKYSRVYVPGKEVDGQWKPNSLGFAWSWGGLIAYSYEKEIGSYVSAMGKVGVQIGNEIAIGVDALAGCGITPYNTFLTNGKNHSMVDRSAFCFKYGVQLWGSLNFSKDTYTAVYGRYIRSIKPTSNFAYLPNGWDVIYEDFDPSSWEIGLAVGYKFGAPEELSTDKRLQASIGTGYLFTGRTGFLLTGELEKITQVSKSTYLSYGLAIEQIFRTGNEKHTSVLLSAGFKVQQPVNRWFWGAKLYGGIGDYGVTFTGETDNTKIEDVTKKLSGKFALQLTTGFKIGKLSEIFAAIRGGFHFGKAIDTDGFDTSSYKNLHGFEADARAGYKFTF